MPKKRITQIKFYNKFSPLLIDFLQKCANANILPDKKSGKKLLAFLELLKKNPQINNEKDKIIADGTFSYYVREENKKLFLYNYNNDDYKVELIPFKA